MAKLEIEIGAINDELKKVLKDSERSLKDFAKGLNFDTKGTKGVNADLTQTKKLLTDITTLAGRAKGGLSGIISKNAKAEIDAERVALSQLRTEAQRYKTDLEKLRTEAQSNRTESTRLKAEIDKLRLANAQNRTSVVASSGSYAEAQQRMTGLGREIRNATGAMNAMTPAIQKKITEYNNLNSRLKAFDAQMGINTRNVGNYKSGILDSIPVLGQFASAAGIAMLAFQGLQRSFSTNLKLDALNYSMMQVSGNMTKFDVTMSYLRSTADRLGLDFVSTVGAFKQWDAAAKYSNLTAGETRKIFDSVANAGAKLKLSNEQVQGTFLALSQMMSKGVVSMEELRRQLGDRIPGAFQLAAKGMNMTEAELMKLVASGQLMSEEFLPKFAAELDKAFGNKQTEKIESLQASVNRLSTAMDMLFESKRATSFFTTITDGLSGAITGFDKLINSNSWKEFFYRFSESNPMVQLSDFIGEKLTGKKFESQGDIVKQTKEYEKLNSIQKATFGYAEKNESVRRKELKDIERIVDLRRKDYQSKEKSNSPLAGKALKELEYQVKIYNEMIRINKDLGMYNKNTGATALSKDKKGGATQNFLDDVKSLMQRSDFSVELQESFGLDELLKRNTQKYKLYLDQLDALSEKTRKGKNVENRSETLAFIDESRKRVIENSAREEKQIRTNFATETANAIDSIQGRVEAKGEEGRKRELANLDKYYTEQRAKFINNQEVLVALSAGYAQEKADINSRWDNKILEQSQGLFDKMNALANKDFRQNIGYSKQGREAIDRDLNKRLKDAEDYYQQIAKLANGDQGLLNKALSDLETTITIILKNGQSAKTPNNRYSGEDINADVYKATQRFQTDFIGALQNITNQGEGLLLGLGQSFTHMFDDVFKNQLNQAFNDFAETGKVSLKGMGSALASVAGSLISGLSKPTSTGGQALGGALSGGASGFMLGGPIGAVIGGAIGALTGIFGASKARKEEADRKKSLALQEAQLQEQKRANALAYTSNIIGQMTRDGLVTSIDRDAFGNIVGKIDGKDIALSVQRTNEAKRR